MTKRTWLCVALAIILLFVLALAVGPARASIPSTSYTASFLLGRNTPQTYVASAYGPCCSGPISRDGENWYRFNHRIHVSVAVYGMPRGTRIVLWIPAQADAYSPELRDHGRIVARYEDGALLTVTDSCFIRRGVPCPYNQIDLSYRILLDAGYCDPADSAYRCLVNWGKRRVTMQTVSEGANAVPPSMG